MYINVDEINAKAAKLSKVTDPEKVKTFDLNTELDFDYKGNFKELYDMVRLGLVKLLTENGQVVGISVHSLQPDIERDNLMARRFERAYSGKDVMGMVQTAFALTVAGIKVDDIVEDGYDLKIYVYSQGKVLDKYLNVIVELGENESATAATIRQVLDEKMSPKRTLVEKATRGRPATKVTNLPDKVVLNPGVVTDTSNKAIKRYLKKEFGYFVAAGCDPTVRTLDNGKLEIANIAWGRQLSYGEMQKCKD